MLALKSLRRSDRGATAIEYAIIAGLIGLGLVGSLVTTRGSLAGVYGKAGTQMAGADAPTSDSPRAPFWQAKTQSGAPIVATQGAWRQTVYNYTDGTQVAYFTNSSASPPTRSVAVVSADHRSITTTTLDANNKTTYQIFQAFRTDISFDGFNGLINVAPDGATGPASANPGPMIFPSSGAHPASYDQYTDWMNFDTSGKPLNYIQDNYNSGGGWTSYGTYTPSQGYIDATTVGGQDVDFFSDTTR